MRLRRLDLLRYGHFTEKFVELPTDGADFHIVFGPNEAGKSTALAAIEDLLFGIPMHSPYNFLHDYSDMRIGAVLESERSSLEVFRRKGTKDTLLGPDDLPLAGGEGALRSFLVDADRSFFERMFSLDHVRLEEGGREILEANDEIGQMLFSAGAGVAGLRDRLLGLSKEADDLWGARRASRRLFTQAEDKLKEADKELREHTFTANKWQELKRAYETADEAYIEVEEKFEKVSAEGKRLSRIRRIYRYVRIKTELDEQLDALGEVVLLPEEAGQVLESAERNETKASAAIDTLLGQLEQVTQDLKALTFDEMLVLRADDMRELHERRIEIRREKADLPKRQSELDAADSELRALAKELGWLEDDVDTLISRIPARAKVGVVRSLLEQRGELAAIVTKSTQALQEAQADLIKLRDRLGGMGEAIDVSRLAAVIKTVRESGDITGRVALAEQQTTEAQERVERLLRSMNPVLPNENDAAAINVPPRAGVQKHRDKVQDWDRRFREAHQKTEAVEREVDRACKAFERTVRDERAITTDELEDARRRRDVLWDLVKFKHIENVPISDEERAAYADELENLPAAFEPAMRLVDEITNQRFDNAEAVGRLAELSRIIDEQKELHDQQLKQELALTKEEEQLKSDWQAMWETAPFEPLESDAMLDWLDVRSELLKAVERRAEVNGGLKIQRKEEHESKERLLTELAALDVDRAPLEDDILRVVLERATDVQREQETAAQGKAQLEESVQDAEDEAERCERDHDRAEKAWAEWQGQWSIALGELGLAPDLVSDAVGAQIEVIDQMRDWAGKVTQLRHDRIDKIVRDVADFESVVAEIVQQVAEDLLGKPADEAVVEIEMRLAEAQRVQEIHKSKSEEVDGLEKQITAMKESRHEAMESLIHLKEAAGVDDANALKEAIESSDALRQLQGKVDENLQTMEQEGDGLAVDDLEKECDEIDLDHVAAREESIATELDALRQQLTTAVEVRSLAREAFQAIGGDDAAAQAAATRQEAIAEMREVATRYVRVRTSAILLQWAIDRYRREKQAPLLKRAGELFATITRGSFSDLRVAYDDQDQAHLTGLRPDGEVVRVPGMSTGTADQLYLALRLASIGDYLERTEALPFVADDLFINFDDDRSAAGFEVLGKLAQETQVLFFTHHQHLVDIARNTLGASVHVVSLA